MKKVKMKAYPVEPFSSLKDMLYQAVKRTPDKTVFKFKEKKEVREVTFTEFLESVNGLGTALSDLGISKTHVAMLGSNSYKWLNVYIFSKVAGEKFQL